jgi:hypothetical protein
MRLLFAAWLVVTCLAGAGCAPLQPYRTEAPAAAYDPALHVCDPSREDSDDAGDIGGKVDARCATRIREDASNYRLYFTEFDDQGWAYPDDAQYGAAGKQIGIFVDELKRSLVQNNERVSVVVFVHGWKHNAHSDDSNVRRFRSLLDSLDLVERTTGCGRHVVGVYVGWRGSSTTLGDPAANLTFYSRKSAAERVALGDVRLLFSHLRALQDMANRPWTERVLRSQIAPAAAAAPGQCDKRMRLSIAGHSFGGLIVYTSLAQALIRDVVELRQAEDEALQKSGTRPTMSREGDLVVVVNPAIEATRYEPLHRAVEERDLPHYHGPLFVAVTSIDDQATRIAFPLGRALSTALERYPAAADGREKRANLNTLGQDDDFLSHSLSAVAYGSAARTAGSVRTDAVCAGWNRPGAPFKERLDIEAGESAAFLKRLADQGYDASGLFPRDFCSVEVLHLATRPGARPAAANSPVWNIRTSQPIVNDHNDFDNQRLIAFFRQLYREAEFREEQVNIRARENVRSEP